LRERSFFQFGADKPRRFFAFEPTRLSRAGRRATRSPKALAIRLCLARAGNPGQEEVGKMTQGKTSHSDDARGPARLLRWAQ
jgi:hypothetical protein